MSKTKQVRRGVSTGNPFAGRLSGLAARLGEMQLDAALIALPANIRAFTGVDCDNACLLVRADGSCVFHTDFRYVPAVERVAPWVTIGDIAKLSGRRPFACGRRRMARIGFEPGISYARYRAFGKAFPQAEFVDAGAELTALRAIKTADECARLRAAAKLNDEIWAEAQKRFAAGMTEREMARIIRRLMLDLGDGEAFDTIVCVGANAAECHHVPDGTVWTGREPVLVDMGVKLDGYCSDMTRNLVPARASKLYRQVYELVLEANRIGLENARAGITAGELDAIVRRFLTRHGFGKAFGHSLGHGVGIEIHEAPFAGRGQSTVLQRGMSLTIEPGIYLPGNLGVRIEDLVLIGEDGCERLSQSPK